MQLIAVLLATVAVTQSPAQKPFDWKDRWHGQTVAVDVISRGEALKGKHFDSKINRLQEHPWNAIQTLLGAYMIARLDEAAADPKNADRKERLAVETCAGVMSMLSTHQQLYEGHVVYQLDDWRQGDKLWREVWDAPMMASTVFHVSDEQTQKLKELCGYVEKPIPQPRHATYAPDDRRPEMELAFAKKLSASELYGLFGQTLDILTADQRRECYNILGRFNKRFDAVLAGPSGR
jgi:hypothetical protein